MAAAASWNRSHAPDPGALYCSGNAHPRRPLIRHRRRRLASAVARHSPAGGPVGRCHRAAAVAHACGLGTVWLPDTITNRRISMRQLFLAAGFVLLFGWSPAKAAGFQWAT